MPTTGQAKGSAEPTAAPVDEDASYNRRARIAIVTARSSPSHERVVNTLKSWGVRVHDDIFLGGIAKALILRMLRPHLFFDDQLDHVKPAVDIVPSVHVPVGITNVGLVQVVSYVSSNPLISALVAVSLQVFADVLANPHR